MTLHNVSVFQHWNERIEEQTQKILENHNKFSNKMLITI